MYQYSTATKMNKQLFIFQKRKCKTDDWKHLFKNISTFDCVVVLVLVLVLGLSSIPSLFGSAQIAAILVLYSSSEMEKQWKART